MKRPLLFIARLLVPLLMTSGCTNQRGSMNCGIPAKGDETAVEFVLRFTRGIPLHDRTVIGFPVRWWSGHFLDIETHKVGPSELRVALEREAGSTDGTATLDLIFEENSTLAELAGAVADVQKLLRDTRSVRRVNLYVVAPNLGQDQRKGSSPEKGGPEKGR